MNLTLTRNIFLSPITGTFYILGENLRKSIWIGIRIILFLVNFTYAKWKVTYFIKHFLVSPILYDQNFNTSRYNENLKKIDHVEDDKNKYYA